MNNDNDDNNWETEKQKKMATDFMDNHFWNKIKWQNVLRLDCGIFFSSIWWMDRVKKKQNKKKSSQKRTTTIMASFCSFIWWLIICDWREQTNKNHFGQTHTGIDRESIIYSIIQTFVLFFYQPHTIPLTIFKTVAISSNICLIHRLTTVCRSYYKIVFACYLPILSFFLFLFFFFYFPFHNSLFIVPWRRRRAYNHKIK